LLPVPWNKHKYAHIDKQAGVKRDRKEWNEDRESLVKRGFGGGEDEDMDGEMDLGRIPRGTKFNIPLVEVTGANKDTAYEPFRHTGEHGGVSGIGKSGGAH
jgi:hypothetical protein